MRKRVHLQLLTLLLLLVGSRAACKKQAPPLPAPATQASTAPASKPAPTTNYVDVVRQSYPKLPATQPLAIPVDYDYAGHWIIPDPVYLDPRNDLWIAREDAPDLVETLKKAVDEQVHIVPTPVAYAYWSVNEEGKTFPRLVLKKSDGGFEWLDGEQHRPITAGRQYRWDAVLVWNDKLIVPSDHGVTIFTFAPDYAETYHEIVPANTDANPVQILLDARGLLAWSPWDGRRPGGNGAQRLVDDKWIDLTATAGWPQKILHLVPLLDGSVLQLITGDDGRVKLALTTLDSTGGGAAIDEAAITKLVEQLSDDDPDKRTAAYAALTRFGPPSWPVLEKVLPDQPPEARIRIQQLLKDRIQPTFGGRTSVDGDVRLVDRFEDGGILLYGPAGVSIPQPDKPPLIVKPAWISIRPGQAIELVEPVLTADASPQRQHFYAVGDEWIVSDSLEGPRRLLGNHLEPMLHKDEVSFTNVIGEDRRGRWLFRRGNADNTAITLASSRPSSPDATLILDPTLPDPTPRLPVWLMWVQKGHVGWDTKDYPVIDRGGAWVLQEKGWMPLDEKRDKMTNAGPVNVAAQPIGPNPMQQGAAPGMNPERLRLRDAKPLKPVAPNAGKFKMPIVPIVEATTEPTTLPAEPPATTTVATTTTAPATTAATQETPILVDADHRKYFDGRESLRIVEPGGKTIEWKLPGNAVSDSSQTPVLIRTADGLLFLFNQPGRVVRIKPTFGDAEPFAVEAIFTHRIPNEDIRRIWLDPAGRIVIAYEGDRLAILFPQGRIPSAIQTLIPASETDQQP